MTIFRYLRYKTILSRTRHINHIRPTSVLQHTGSPDHHVRVDIDGIDRVGYTNTVVPADQFLDVARIRFCPVINEYLVNIQMNAARQEIILQNGFT